MPFRSVSDPEQVAILAGVLEDLCSAAGIEADSPERLSLAELIVNLFWDGKHTAAELRAAVTRRIEEEERQYG